MDYDWVLICADVHINKQRQLLWWMQSWYDDMMIMTLSRRISKVQYKKMLRVQKW